MTTFKLEDVQMIENPVLCCGSCNTPAFILPPNLKVSDRVVDSILQSKAIPPQPTPELDQAAKCATCGTSWTIRSFTLIEGGTFHGQT